VGQARDESGREPGLNPFDVVLALMLATAPLPLTGGWRGLVWVGLMIVITWVLRLTRGSSRA
jgi:hypothetical protein